jgi:glyoxylase-like metal-dependent hydrolase (beta-lactamase superfamily II)
MDAERPLIEGRAQTKSWSTKLFGGPKSGPCVAKYLKDRQRFQLGGVTITSYLVPGHTDGSAAYLIGGTLFLGDSADSGEDEASSLGSVN